MVDEAEVVRLYVDDRWTLRQIAQRFGTDHHRIARILQRHGVPLSPATRLRKPLTEETRRRMSAARMGVKSWSAGKSMTDAWKRRNMKMKMRANIDLDRYPDFERLKFLTYYLSRHKKHLGASDEERQAFLDRFYFDIAFNVLYDLWLVSGKNEWCYPSLDHINPKANGGTWELGNLRFITWFENRAKAHMTLAQWDAFRAETDTRSRLFIEEILRDYRQGDDEHHRGGQG